MAINSLGELAVGGSSSSGDLISTASTPNAFITYYQSDFTVKWTAQFPDFCNNIGSLAFDI